MSRTPSPTPASSAATSFETDRVSCTRLSVGRCATVTDPLRLREETEAALAYVAAEAGRYLEGLDAAPVLAPGAEAAARRFGGALPETGRRRRRSPEGAGRGRARGGNGLGGAALLPFRHRRRHTGRSRRRLARVDTRPERILQRQLAARSAARAGLDRLAARPVRAPCLVGWRADDGRDDGELHGARGRSPLVGGAARRGRRCGRLGGARRGARLLERIRASERDQGARHARHRPRECPRARPRRRGTPRRRGARGRATLAGRRACDRDRERRRREHRRLRPDHADGRPGRAPRRLAPRRRSVRTLRPGDPADGGARRGCRAGRFGHRRRAQVAERPLRLRLRLRARAVRSPRDVRAHGGLPARRQPARPRSLEALPLAGGVGDVASLRSRGVPGDGRAPPGPCSAPREPYRREPSPRTARRRAAEHRLLPAATARSRRAGARRAQHASRARPCSPTDGSTWEPPDTTDGSRFGRRSSTGERPLRTST